MARRTMRRDPIENEIELALSPGEFICDRMCFSFVSGLERVVTKIDVLAATDPARAAGLCETFLAGCHAKAEELHDSSGGFGQFARDLICRWIKARQAAGADPNETAATFLAWVDDDPYAFCYQIEKDVTKAFNKPGRVAFEKLVRKRFETAPKQPEYNRRRWGAVLRAVYLAQRNVSAYESLAEETGLTAQDCLALAAIFVSGKPSQALEWVERGIALGREAPTNPLPPTISPDSSASCSPNSAEEMRRSMPPGPNMREILPSTAMTRSCSSSRRGNVPLGMRRRWTQPSVPICTRR